MKRYFRAIILFIPLVSLGAQDRVVERVDTARRSTLRGHVHPLAVPANDIGAVDPTYELSYATLLLRPASGLEEFLREQQTPGSPNYRRWLTPEQFADRFGLTPADIDKVTAWLRAEGLQVRDVARGRTWIAFSGSAGRVGRALGTRFHRFRARGEDHVANLDDPSVPSALSGVIAGFSGLDDFEPQPLYRLSDTPLYTSTSGAHSIAPDDFATIYNVKPLYAAGLDGTGVGIAVIGRSSIDLNDMRAFRSRFGLPPNDPKLVLVGADPGRTSAVLESNLDLQWAGAVARNAAISYVYAANVRTAMQYAIDRNVAPIITYSYGACELASSANTRSLIQQANAQGITFVAASGDQAAAVCDFILSDTPQAAKGPTMSDPANIPEVTAVGGTQFNEGSGSYWNRTNDSNLASAQSYIPEAVWTEAELRNELVASTGGPSMFFPKPYWQTGPGVPDDKARDVPDVSLAASSAHDPYRIVVTGLDTLVGGTSVGSPAFAGVVALLNHALLKNGTINQPGLGNINPALYRLAQAAPEVFHDVVEGDNKVPCVQSSPSCIEGRLGFAAAPGYDLATGLGSIDADRLIARWDNGAASATSLTATPERGGADTTVTLTATVSGGGKTAPTGVVTFLVNDFAVASATLAQGAATATVRAAVAAGTVTAHYSGDAVYSPSSATASVGLDLPVAGSLVVASVAPNPVPRSASGFWPYTVVLSEKAGVATRITGLSFGNQDNANFIRNFNNGVVPAKGTVSASFFALQPEDPVPGDVVMRIQGADADGRQWKQEVTVTFLDSTRPAVAPGIVLTSNPSNAQRNPTADPACQWSQELTLGETGGYLVLLTRLNAAGQDLSGQIQPLFGATRLAPFGTLRAPLCWDQNTIPGSTKTFTVTGTAEDGTTVTASAVVGFQAPASPAVDLHIAPQSLLLTAADNQHEAASAIDIGVNRAATQWKASVAPASAATSWLKLGRVSGTSDGQLTLRADTSALSNGVYRASIAIEAPGAVPDHFTVPVVLIVGPSDKKILGVQNAASFAQAFAPGMLMTVYMEGLTGNASSAGRVPLPYTLGGVSATVNGISAPILAVAPASGQINLQVPYEAGAGPAALAVRTGSQIAYLPFTLSVAAPGLFGIWDTAGRPVTAARPGQTLVAYITGQGDITPFVATGNAAAAGTAASRLPKGLQPLSISVGGSDATVLFNGLPAGLVGVTQINFTVPAATPAGPQPVVVKVGGARTQEITLDIQPQ